MANTQNAKPKVTVPTDSESVISMILGAMVVVVIGALAFSYIRNWRQNRQAAEETPTEEQQQNVVEVTELPTEVMTETDETGREVPTNLPARYTVREGDSTWAIAEAFYGSGFNYVDIETENSLNPDQELTPGMQLTIPKVSVRTQEEAGVPRSAMTETVQEMQEQNPDQPVQTKGGMTTPVNTQE
ncbi:LysM peptidoglycan-binding domain-containing protein [Candidatus Woesebacteria bacterium]|nr:LysM peptidoglycan-binding domain-containing protein [Candidatus Woesebacteria bacterium]MCD8507576.1 LysM peptidoglycan-binding domain-containing protein [Candidatus Woesebacteria bacterium]MCD8527416.1 LysM peptidoglycan-binding domain-containing protein [Candidatus Woesebacteria bacterium]MCD8546163.1 LysM peptidoglycan-binding domain-containing protein [Candidatus Woesebacteria bacterium]